ncbi:MAG: hypothetical protein AABZ23_02060 [Deltaproteobacteria bacterium]
MVEDFKETVQDASMPKIVSDSGPKAPAANTAPLAEQDAKKQKKGE